MEAKHKVEDFLHEPTIQQYKSSKREIMKALNSMTDADKFYYLHRIGKNPNPKAMLVSAVITENCKVFKLVRDNEIEPSRYLKGKELGFFNYRMTGEGDPLLILMSEENNPGLSRESKFYHYLLNDIVKYYSHSKKRKELQAGIRDGTILLSKEEVVDLIARTDNKELIVLLIELYNKGESKPLIVADKKKSPKPTPFQLVVEKLTGEECGLINNE